MCLYMYTCTYLHPHSLSYALKICVQASPKAIRPAGSGFRGLRFGARFQASLPTIATPFASICYFCCCLDLCRLVVIIASFLCWWSYSKREPESHNAKMLNPGPRFPRSLEKSCAAERHRHADNGERPL